ncbi:hypothetical protein BDN72DRAFT_860674 [Pluteus cervinus]|uniref:Uncharacterized protein n=1 Tax=Pluteus cervinus TaxID=181527 RepID=A0ACD3AI35_9AGAR|nr:hypothetical protein BDN72DRAFT_860674 [Pluteus cervinus]
MADDANSSTEDLGGLFSWKRAQDSSGWPQIPHFKGEIPPEWGKLSSDGRLSSFHTEIGDEAQGEMSGNRSLSPELGPPPRFLPDLIATGDGPRGVIDGTRSAGLPVKSPEGRVWLGNFLHWGLSQVPLTAHTRRLIPLTSFHEYFDHHISAAPPSLTQIFPHVKEAIVKPLASLTQWVIESLDGYDQKLLGDWFDDDEKRRNVHLTVKLIREFEAELSRRQKNHGVYERTHLVNRESLLSSRFRESPEYEGLLASRRCENLVPVTSPSNKEVLSTTVHYKLELTQCENRPIDEVEHNDGTSSRYSFVSK